ncbi:MAG: hypothetical protein KBE35_12155 [Ferruginibacter sp.]|nr:hypothetical protein [Ferruginibacter sp.]
MLPLAWRHKWRPAHGSLTYDGRVTVATMTSKSVVANYGQLLAFYFLLNYDNTSLPFI